MATTKFRVAIFADNGTKNSKPIYETDIRADHVGHLIAIVSGPEGGNVSREMIVHPTANGKSRGKYRKAGKASTYGQGNAIVQTILDHGRPMHINEIKSLTKKNSTQVVSALSHNIRRGGGSIKRLRYCIYAPADYVEADHERT